MATRTQPSDPPPEQRVLHVISQRPGLTGSGIFVQALVREGSAAGLVQHVVVGGSALGDDRRSLGLAAEAVHPVLFETERLPFRLPGMSDVMPYPSTRFSDLSPRQVDAYLAAFASAIRDAAHSLQANRVWSHHLWLASAVVKEVLPDMPQVAVCHGTDLRQLDLAPYLAPYVVERCSRIDRILTLTHHQKEEVLRRLNVRPSSVEVIGPGVRTDLFRPGPDHRPGPIEVVYVGKLSKAKGVPWLLEAFQRIDRVHGGAARLTLVGHGEGDEAEEILRSIHTCRASVRLVGVLTQEELAKRLGRSDILVLPSFFEGLGLVVLEALAAGCRVVATDLAGLREVLPAEALASGAVSFVPLPRLAGPDVPFPEDLPGFTAALEAALSTQIENARPDTAGERRKRSSLAGAFSWPAVFRRVLEVSAGA
jgi:glycosyltransferase involved in cell wall biosynthesis